MGTAGLAVSSDSPPGPQGSFKCQKADALHEEVRLLWESRDPPCVHDLLLLLPECEGCWEPPQRRGHLVRAGRNSREGVGAGVRVGLQKADDAGSSWCRGKRTELWVGSARSLDNIPGRLQKSVILGKVRGV